MTAAPGPLDRTIPLPRACPNPVRFFRAVMTSLSGPTSACVEDSVPVASPARRVLPETLFDESDDALCRVEEAAVHLGPTAE